MILRYDQVAGLRDSAFVAPVTGEIAPSFVRVAGKKINEVLPAERALAPPAGATSVPRAPPGLVPGSWAAPIIGVRLLGLAASLMCTRYAGRGRLALRAYAVPETLVDRRPVGEHPHVPVVCE